MKSGRFIWGLFALAMIACTAREDAGMPDETPAILLFAGTGTSSSDVSAIKDILRAHNLHFAAANSNQLDAMSEAQLRQYRLLIVPGGNFEQMGNGLAPRMSATIRTAVHGGLNYLGVCAGAFMAGDSPYNGLNLTNGVRFKFYELERQNIRKAAVTVSVAGSSNFDHYWEDGPELSGWGDVIARYPDGTPAVVQGNVGSGWVILSGIHPEAPESWRGGMDFKTPASVDNAYAASLIEAALNRTRLAQF